MKRRYVYNVDEETIEIELNDKEIIELTDKLNELKSSRTHIHFNFNNNKRDLLIHHEGDELK